MADDEEVDNYETLILVVSGISLILCFLCFITWGMFSVKAKQKMTFWVTFNSVCVTSFVFFPTAINGVRGVYCKDDIEPVKQSDGITPCLLQGMAILFFGLSLCCWWWCSCFDLFNKLFLRKRNIGHYLTYYHIFSWGLPFVCTIAVLGTGEFGYEQPRLWCFLANGAPDPFEYVFFYGWIALLWFTGSVMFFLTVYSIFTGSNKSMKNNYLKKLSIYRVPLIFVLIFSVFWAIFFCFTVIAAVQEDQFVASAESWFACILTTFAIDNTLDATVEAPAVAVALLDPQPSFRDGETPNCGTTQPGRLSPGLLTIAILALSGNGTLLFIIFGLQYQNFALWKAYIGSGFNPESVRPKRKADTKVVVKQKSIFQELILGLALKTIACCQKCAGIKAAPVEGQYGYSTPILNTDNGSYQPKFIDNRTEVTAQAKAVNSQDAANFPRVSYSNRQSPYGLEYDETPLNPSYTESQDPFPGQSQVNKRLPEGAPPPGLEQFYSSRANHVSATEWSDIYDDDLWANVEF